MPRNRTRHASPENIQFAAEFKEIFDMIGKKPHYQPETLERKVKHELIDSKKIKALKKDIEDLEDYLIVHEHELPREEINKIVYVIKFLRTRIQVLTHHLPSYPNFNNHGKNDPDEIAELNRLAGKTTKGGRRLRNSTRRLTKK
jgi:hypothetical protein